MRFWTVRRCKVGAAVCTGPAPGNRLQRLRALVSMGLRPVRHFAVKDAERSVSCPLAHTWPASTQPFSPSAAALQATGLRGRQGAPWGSGAALSTGPDRLPRLRWTLGLHGPWRVCAFQEFINRELNLLRPLGSQRRLNRLSRTPRK